jgi:hypothetical protein
MQDIVVPPPLAVQPRYQLRCVAGQDGTAQQLRLQAKVGHSCLQYLWVQLQGICRYRRYR